MEFSQVVLYFNHRDMHGADGVCWETRPVGESIFFPGSCRLLGVGTVYVTSLENSADVLFGVGVASFIFRRRVAFLFCVAAAKNKAGYPNSKKTSAEFSKLVTYTVPTPKSRHKPRKNTPSPTDRVSQQKSSTPCRSRRLKSNTVWENSIRTVSVNRRETNALLQVFSNAVFGPGPAFPNPTQSLPHHAHYSANSVMCEETGAALEYRHLKLVQILNYGLDPRQKIFDA